MWKCRKCEESVEDAFEVCWNCGTSESGVEDPAFRRTPGDRPVSARDHGPRGAQSRPAGSPDSRANPIACPRCNEALEHLGTKRFHEGTNWGMLGELGELFVKRERFDVYVCPRCGRVELFVDGLGEQFRPQ